MLTDNFSKNSDIDPGDNTAKIHKKVAWVTPVLGINGKLLYWDKLFDEFQSCFTNFEIFTLEFDGSWNKTGLKLNRSGTFVRLYLGWGKWKKTGSGVLSGFSFASPRIILHLLKYKPDLIIINEFSLVSIYALIYANVIRRKTRTLLLVESAPAFKESKLLNKVKIFQRKLVTFFSDAILTNNSAGLEYLINTLCVKNSKITTAPYLVSFPPSVTKKIPTDRKDQSIHFLYVGRLVSQKGIQHAINAISMLPEEAKKQLIYHVVGDGPFLPMLKKQIVAQGLEKNIILHGRIDYDRVQAFYLDADALLFPTLLDYRALAPFEAMSFGLPILGSIYDGGHHETVKDGVNGYLLDPKNEHQMVEKIAFLIRNRTELIHFSKASITMAKKYDYPSAKKTLLEACHCALSNNSSI